MRIQASDIAGARVIEVYAIDEIRDGLEVCEVYFAVDRGFSFALPNRGDLWMTTEIPPKAERKEDEILIPQSVMKKGWFGRYKLVASAPKVSDLVKRIKQRRIAGLFCRRPHEDDWEPSEAILVFEDASQMWNEKYSPDGTGAAGLYLVEGGSEGCIPMSELVDYFSFPVRDRES